MNGRWNHVTIFEGPDGAGKTTLLRHFVARESFNDRPTAELHLGPHEGDPLDELKRHLLAHDRSYMALDRFHLGEQVYGPVYRGVDRLGAAGRQEIEWFLVDRRAVVVLALPQYVVCRANWERRKAEGGEMFPDPRAHRRVWQAYHAVRTCLPVVMYDYTMVGPDKALEAIAEARDHAYPERRAA